MNSEKFSSSSSSSPPFASNSASSSMKVLGESISTGRSPRLERRAEIRSCAKRDQRESEGKARCEVLTMRSIPQTLAKRTRRSVSSMQTNSSTVHEVRMAQAVNELTSASWRR